MEVCGKELRIDRRLVRVGYIDGEGYQFLEDPDAAVAHLRESRAPVDLFTFIPRFSEVAKTYNYPVEMDNMAVLPVSTFDNWMTKQIDFKVRNKVRKSAKNGVEVKEVPLDEHLLRGISVIYNETPIRQGRKFWHYGKDLQALRAMKETFLERSAFLGAFFQDELIGFIKLTWDEQRSQAGLMHIVSMMKHRDKAPTNALMAQAVRSCADRGIQRLWYANMSYGQKGIDSLADFKRHNGFERFELPRYYVPLNMAGRVALRYTLYRTIIDLVPKPLSEKYRKVRSQWYAKKYPGPESA